MPETPPGNVVRMNAQQNTPEASEWQTHASIPLSESTQAAVDRNRSQRASGGLFSRVLLFLLVGLALAASILMLFTNSELWTKIAVIAALWAAGLGAFLVSRYTSTLAANENRERELEERHRAELEREKAQFLQREAELKSEYSNSTRRNRDEQLEALRAELAYLRKQLTEMSGQDYSESSQRAVRARAERVHELGFGENRHSERTVAGMGADSSTSAHTSTLGEEKTSEEKSAARPRPRTVDSLTTGSFAAVKWSGPNGDSEPESEETTQIPLVVDHSHSGDRTVQLTSTDTADTGGTGNRGFHSAPHIHTHAAEGSHHAASSNGAHRRGRRRADETEGGLTVAELLARAKRGDN